MYISTYKIYYVMSLVLRSMEIGHVIIF